MCSQPRTQSHLPETRPNVALLIRPFRHLPRREAGTPDRKTTGTEFGKEKEGPSRVSQTTPTPPPESSSGSTTRQELSFALPQVFPENPNTAPESLGVVNAFVFHVRLTGVAAARIVSGKGLSGSPSQPTCGEGASPRGQGVAEVTAFSHNADGREQRPVTGDSARC